MEERGGAANPGLNDFKKALEEMEMGMNEKEEVRKAKQGGEAKEGGGKGDGHGMGMGEGGILDLGLLKTDPEKLYPLIYYALKVGPCCSCSSTNETRRKREGKERERAS